MDVSEMCIDTSNVEEEASIERSSESSKRKLENDDRSEYQQLYQLQHRYLKSYQDYIEDDPIPTVEENSKLLKQLIDKCNLVYQQIGKYRQDPLREAERNQIIDQVYFTAESMLKDLDKLKNQDIDNVPDEPSVSSNESSTSEKYKMIRQARNLQKTSQPKYKRRSRNTMVGHRCHSCNTTDTPEWRRGPDGARTLCNACGLHYSKLLKNGSLTIQTHNYMETPPPQKDPTKAIDWNF